ncbi:MAG: C25 family cysteine peptidase, partial [Ignavibacteriaceae bacterium]
VYIPSRGELIKNPYIANDVDKSVYFFDTISVQTDYYCVADDYFSLPDSIVQNEPSDLRNINNGADYIIITHRDFISAAQRLAEYRSSNLHGVSEPRTKVVDIDQIYNEFSYGLMNPVALTSFAKYTFENWQLPAPQYIVLLGDMSYDYRKIFSASRDNYIPSPPYHAYIYGQAPSDNSIVTVAGNDIFPDIALGRISCETLDEANILIDKIINYPADASKEWKQNVLLLSSGLSADDENQFKFNDRNMLLENTYLKPSGIRSTKIFRYPNKPEYIPFQGEGPDIRREIDNGATIVNYYGHGGGLQWDLVFTNDDIYELNNGNKLPFVISVTCYTAHFDNQEIFGEIFNSIPNKGSIAFFGSSGVTFWPTTANLNQDLFEDIFNNKNYVIGKAINYSKNNQAYGSMISLLTLLGDPAIELTLPYKPDFVIKPSSISIEPNNPLVNDSVTVKLKIDNLGRSFPNDSVLVKLYERIISDTTLIGSVLLPNFGENDSTEFTWFPKKSGLVTLIASVNDNQRISEDDYSDNVANRSFSIFDFGEPSIVKPANGYFSNVDSIDFLISDVGFYFNRDFNYLIQINNLPQFDSLQLLAESPILNDTDAIVRWNSGNLASGEYFWRAIVYDDVDTNFSSTRIFTITDKNGSGYLAQKQGLNLFSNSNINYSNESNSLVLNTQLKPPYPSPKFLLDSIYFDIPPDQTKPSIFTTDGSYFYFGTLPPFNNWNRSKIYKIGTGLNGTNSGENYGTIPNFEGYIYGNLMLHDDYLYCCTGSTNMLCKVNIQNGDTTQVIIPDSLLVSITKSTQIGGVYLFSDGQYVYNLGIGTWNYPDKFVLRKFDPQNNWNIVGEDLILSGFTTPLVASFIVSQGYIITYENIRARALRRYRLEDGKFEEEWIYAPQLKDYYTIAYDHQNDLVYFNTFRPGTTLYVPAFFKYRGSYIEANGQISSQDIGPASKWNNLEFNIDQTNSNGIYKGYLLGKNKSNGSWVTLDSLIQSNLNIDNINAKQYNYIKLKFDFADSSFGSGEPMKFNSLKVNYEYLPEISIIPKNLSFIPDSVLQGISLDMNLKVNNFGYITADSLKLEFSNNLTDTVFYTTYISVPNDTFSTSVKTIITDNLLYTAPVSPIDVKVVVSSPIDEYYTFNNQINNLFYVIRDSANPLFNITFDGREIINGDIISSEPEVIITLEDDSPLPLDSTYFTIVHTYNNIPKVLTVPGPDITYNYTPYPNSRAVITWTPKLEDGRHVLEVLAKDASGNFFDSTSSRSVFNVYNNPDLLQVYNYPNPFSDNTHFTFELRGIIPPEELKIKIFTVAGRLIREIILPSASLQIGFNKIYWDGKDEDGDEIANGLYFYKIISKHGDEVKTITQKLAKVK